MESKISVFPLYLMIKDGSRVWMRIIDAGRLYNHGFISVSIGGQVMEEGGSEREITDEERQRIVNIADDYSGSK